MVTPQYERIVGGANTSVTLSGLEPGTTYRIRVWSTDGTSVSSEAKEMNVTTVENGERCYHLYLLSMYHKWHFIYNNNIKVVRGLTIINYIMIAIQCYV